MKIDTPIWPLIVLCLVAAVSQGCASKITPASLPKDLPGTWGTWAGPAVKQAEPDIAPCLLDLLDHDPAQDSIRALVNEALQNNPDLGATAARLKASGFLLTRTASRQWPEITAGMTRARDNLGLDPVSGRPDTQNRYQISADISWELDIWGRLADEHRAAALGVKALAKDFDRAADALAARVIQAWINCAAGQKTLDLEKERVKALAGIETDIETRYRDGLGSLEDLSAARTRTQVARANVSDRQEALGRARRKLELLLGRYPRAEILDVWILPSIRMAPAMPPAAALRRRPDIQAALARVDADQFTALAAEKNQLPGIRLVSELSRSSTAFSGLGAADHLWRLAAGLTQPLFNAGRLKGTARAKAMTVQAAVSDLAQAVLTAMSEVEACADREKELAVQESALAAAAVEAERSAAYFTTRYCKGLDNIQSLLIAREQEMNIKSRLLDIRAGRMTNRVSMALALGLAVRQSPSKELKAP